MDKIEKLEQLVEILEEYIKLLGEELGETVMMAHIHGWQSTRQQQGIDIRKRIQEIKEQL